MESKYYIKEETLKFYKESLSDESDRARVIITTAWVDSLFELKFKSFFSKGNKDTRKKLYKMNGPFSTLSSKISTAYCAGWLDQDVFNDIELLRKIRNKFAHDHGELSLSNPKIIELLKQFEVPKREYHDWEKIKICEFKEKAKVYGELSENMKIEDVELPAQYVFHLIANWIFIVLVENLGIPVKNSKTGECHIVELADYLKYTNRNTHPGEKRS